MFFFVFFLSFRIFMAFIRLFLIVCDFLDKRAKKTLAEARSPPQKLEVGPRSWPNLLVAR